MKNPFFKKTLTTAHTQNKNFAFSKEKVKLNFTLRIDITSELQDFKELLEQAIIDVDKELIKHTIYAKGGGGG